MPTSVQSKINKARSEIEEHSIVVFAYSVATAEPCRLLQVGGCRRAEPRNILFFPAYSPRLCRLSNHDMSPGGGSNHSADHRSYFLGCTEMHDAIANQLEQRLGRLHAKRRLGIEQDHEAQIFGQGINLFHIENWYSIHALIRNALKLGGIFWRGQRNAERIQVRHNYVRCQRLPRAFVDFTLLHISDLHVDMNKGAMRRLEELLPDLEYDICVITGDYRGATFGPFAEALEGMKRLRSHLGKAVYGVLGNHDTIRMVPGLEAMGIRILLNEC
jgi:Calcineurin-like phosphoesterase